MMVEILAAAGTAVHTGILLPESTLQSNWFAVLAAFVAINTVMYAVLAVAKILPKWYLSDLFTSRNRRTETRSIYPENDA